MALTDDALSALVGVVGDIHAGKIAASESDIELLVWTLEVLATLGDENER
ncbi:hypothetical protein RN51_01344 [Microbacterium oxydans]|uniref:Uncharacterized protein n=1 Tax=Microbacterium oxydans TaxID=82380 RepID=A0A0F0KSG7_9MICO|nr:hypothetical protein [Microbacterium oxydans]KJL23808.1 hypothetical protein RN51_01344 [Microbacterium oxydans]